MGIAVVIKCHLASRFLVPKLQINPGTKSAPPDTGRDIAAPQVLGRMGPRRNIHGTKTAAQTVVSLPTDAVAVL
jgi:hypothetical protein